MLIGIIGGKGVMGRWFADFFKKNNCKVIVSDLGTKLTNKELAGKCDVVIVSVPISKSVSVINEIKKYVKKDSLLMDVTSLKNKQVKAMLNGTKCSVLGTHPMFGPGVKSIKSQTVILCKGRGDRWFKWFKSLLIRNKAIIKTTSPQKNDEFMSVIQGLMHFNSIATVNAMNNLGFDLKESLGYTSPVYRLNLDILCRILNQNPRLYGDIVIDNKNTKKVLDVYLKSINKLKKMISNKNKKGFIKLFNESANYLGDFKHKAEKESDYLIEQLVNR